MELQLIRKVCDSCGKTEDFTANDMNKESLGKWITVSQQWMERRKADAECYALLLRAVPSKHAEG